MMLKTVILLVTLFFGMTGATDVEDLNNLRQLTNKNSKLGECRGDCNSDKDCKKGLLCSNNRDNLLEEAGLDPRKAYCGNVGKSGDEVCFNPKNCGVVGCDDKNYCTTDLCDPILGCTHTPVTCPCNQSCDRMDGRCKEICTKEDCDDKNLCTNDDCDPLNPGQCIHSESVKCEKNYSCDPMDGKCKCQDLLTPCVSVIDESDNFLDSDIDIKWAAFRKAYPDRPFCLLRPTSTFGFLYLPAAFKADPLAIFAEVTREDGVGNVVGTVLPPISDWYNICQLGKVSSSINYVGVFIDESGSMTRAEVKTAYNTFNTALTNVGLTIQSVYNTQEDWVSPFITTLVPGDKVC